MKMNKTKSLGTPKCSLRKHIARVVSLLIFVTLHVAHYLSTSPATSTPVRSMYPATTFSAHFPKLMPELSFRISYGTCMSFRPSTPSHNWPRLVPFNHQRRYNMQPHQKPRISLLQYALGDRSQLHATRAYLAVSLHHANESLLMGQ